MDFSGVRQGVMVVLSVMFNMLAFCLGGAVFEMFGPTAGVAAFLFAAAAGTIVGSIIEVRLKASFRVWGRIGRISVQPAVVPALETASTAGPHC